MRRKKNTDLYAVQDTKDVTEAVIDRVLAGRKTAFRRI